MHLFDSSNTIHPTAIIGPEVTMGNNNRIGPHCILHGKVTLGHNNDIKATLSTDHIVTIGNNCTIYPNVTLGFAGEMGAKGDKLPKEAGVEIEDGVTIREFVNVHAPYWWPATRISKNAYIMNKAYIAHDVQIGRGVIINAAVCLGGRAVVHDFANVGMGVTVHQRSVIGESAMVGMSSAVKRHIPPFAVVAGVPAKILKFNYIGAKRRSYESIDIERIKTNFKKVIQSPQTESHPIGRAVKAFYKDHPEALRDFI